MNMRTETKQKTIGICYLLGAALCFACMNLFVNKAGALPLMQKVFFRNCITVAVVFVLLLCSKEKFRIHDKSCILWLLLRAAIGFLGVILNFYAIDHIGSISDASILNKLSPFFAIVFSVFLLKEKPRLVEMIFVIIAFGGAMFVVKPSFSAQALPALFGFLSGACAGFAYTCVRILGKKGERGNMTVFIFAVLAAACGSSRNGRTVFYYRSLSPRARQRNCGVRLCAGALRGDPRLFVPFADPRLVERGGLRHHNRRGGGQMALRIEAPRAAPRAARRNGNRRTSASAG